MFNNQVKVPLAKRIPKTTSIHHDTLHDDYFWLRDADNPEVIQYLEAENAYLESVMQPTQGLQETLYQEMLSHIQETDDSVPVQDGDYFYYARSEKDKQYPIYCRKLSNSRATLETNPEEILIDFNILAEGKAFFSVSQVKLSPDHQKLAYLQNENGTDYYTLYIKDIASKADVITPVDNLYIQNSLEWANNQILFYIAANEQQRPHKLFKFSLETQQSTLIYQETDEAFFFSLEKSRSGQFLFAGSGNMDTSEVRYVSTAHPNEAWTLFAPKVSGIMYELEHHGNNFFILSNQNAKNFRLLKTAIDKPKQEHWQEVLEHQQDVYLQSIHPFAHHLLITGRKNGLTQLWVQDLKTKTIQQLNCSEPIYTVFVSDNRLFDSDKVLIGFQSMLTPPSILELDLNTLAPTLVKQDQVNNYNQNDYSSEQIWATAADGTKIPISLLYKKGLSGPASLLLYGYGAYGSSYDPSFNSNRLALLDRGVIFAIAHIRGGAEMGRDWYEQGKMLSKKNSFTDFIACAEYLIRQGYTSKEKLAAMGLSAGGLLMGAVTTMRPDLFKAVVAKVPFVDVVNTMLDPTLPLVGIEYDEWGNPNKPDEYAYMKSYSPYDNIEPNHYPHLFVTGGLNDPRVPYWEPAKWVAKLRAHKSDNNVLIFKTHMEAGHLGSSGRYGQLRDVALEYAFILTALEDVKEKGESEK
jgi:oligopeptidase B